MRTKPIIQQRLTAITVPSVSYTHLDVYKRQQKARIKATEADILIINHSLLIANAANEGGLLPELPYLIIDEAQHLEHATEDQLTSVLDFFDILNLLGRYERKERGKRVGVIPSLEKAETNLFDNLLQERLVSFAARCV